MKVAFLSPSLSRIAGGIFEIERELALALDRAPDITVSAFGVSDDQSEADRASWEGVPVRYGALLGPQGFGYSRELRRLYLANDADITHLHVMWMYTSVLARDWHRRTGKPYVVTANGMLEPWAQKNSSLKKRLAAFAYERSMLREMACLHVNTPAELESARAFGVEGPFCVIPNGVSLPPADASTDAAPEAVRRARAEGARILLYLGRLHPKKNLLATLEAFIALAPSHPDWHFVAAGWGAEHYVALLRATARRSGFADRIHFPGPTFGAAKDALFAIADAFVLASHSEGFPMAVLEAFAHALPVAMTPMCNLQIGFDVGAAVAIGTSAEDVAHGLGTLFALGDAGRAAMGGHGRALVERQFTWPRIAGQMGDVYRWLLEGGAVPATVSL